jgi:hypothetical protein
VTIVTKSAVLIKNNVTFSVYIVTILNILTMTPSVLTIVNMDTIHLKTQSEVAKNVLLHVYTVETNSSVNLAYGTI